MKQYLNNYCRNGRTFTACALASIILLLCGCSEELYSPNAHDGEVTTITLNYSDSSPRDITVNTRATEVEERHLDDLYIYIFNEDGYLTGYKQVTTGLDQNTSSTNQATVYGIKTRVGLSYIYAVANISTGLYPVKTSSGTIEEGKLPVDLDETKAQNCEYDFTKDMLLNLDFLRNNDKTIQISSAFLMSGAVNNGQTVTIGNNGNITGGNVIKLNRIVSKVKFTASITVAGCTSEATKTINVHARPTVTLSGNDYVCQGSTEGLKLTATKTGNAADATSNAWVWNINNTNSNENTLKNNQHEKRSENFVLTQ